MADLIPSGSGGFVSLLHGGHGGDLVMPKPFAHEIYLFDTHVAGTTHIEGIKELEPYLNIEDKLIFLREPNNPYDPKAILIQTSSGVKIGYVPKVDNIIFARLMDAGKLLFGRISQKEVKGNWVKIDIKIYLQE
ncbi:HIRAN domain-containing protein [Chakrabartyella piscis]|uniref:HIRAN domain-containing protein n=1 Tax=Chakrabartyella piscis TaxID=2918914 RepID=UPI0029588BA4|nr:HIRAN domain-containing protein [Chakrabartyella piscis]